MTATTTMDQHTMTNLYDVLDVEPTSSADEIRAAWRASVAELDPTDRRFRVYNQAAEVLLDPARRAEYDAALAPDPEPERGRADTAQGRRIDRTETGASSRARTHGWHTGVPGWLLVAAAGVTAVLLGFVGVALTEPSPAAVASDTGAARAAAERAIVPILSYDYRDLDQSRDQAVPYMSSDERAQYDKLFAVIRQNAPRLHTVVHATYVASGVVRSGTDRVDVLLFVDQATTNQQHPKTPVVYKNQVTVTMAKQGDQWVVDTMTTSAGQS
jgi:Mce-associated membrane protein